MLFALAFLAGQRILQGAENTVEVWAAARDLPSDSELSQSDVEVVDVRMPADLLDRYISASSRVDGDVLTVPVRAGELIPQGWIASEAVAQRGRSMTIPVTPEHAVGGDLRPGDRLDVYATFDAQDIRARTTVVARSVPVLKTVSTGGIVTGEQATIGVTVSVTPQEASRLAYAIRAGEIDIARVDSRSGDSPQPATVTDEDMR